MAIITSDGFKTARNNEDYPKSKVQILMPNLSMANKYGCVATASSEVASYEATHSNDGNRTHQGGWWQSNPFSPAYTAAGLGAYGTLNAFYKLEVAAPMDDSSGNGFNATDHGTADVAGIIDRGRTFVSGESDYIEMPAGCALAVNQHFSQIQWIKPTITNVDIGLYWWGGANGYTVCYGNADGTIYLLRWTAAGRKDLLTVTNLLTANVWNMVAWGWDGTNIWVSVNGAARETLAAGDCTQIGTTCTLGQAFGIGYFNGIMDEVIIYWDDLLDADLTAIYSSGAPTRAGVTSHYLQHALLPEANILVEYDENAEWDLGTFVDTLDTEITDSVTLNGLYDYAFLPDSTNCKLFLKMDNDGDEIDYSGNGNHAIMSGTVPQQAGGIVSKARGAFSVSNYFSIADSANIRASDNFSCSFWVKRTSNFANDGDAEYLFMKGIDGGDFDFLCFIQRDDLIPAHYLNFQFGNGVGGTIISTTNIPLNIWTHISITYDLADKLIIYINGAVDTNSDAGAAKVTSTGSLYIGKEMSDTYPGTHIYLDELMVYQSTLTAGNVATLYAAGAPYRRLASGTWESPEIDLGFIPSGGIGTLVWEENSPPNTDITMEVDYSDDGIIWDGYIAITNGGTLDTRQYVQFRATLATTDQLFSPALSKLTIKWKPLTRKLSQVIVYGYTGNNYITSCYLQYWSGSAWTNITPTKVWGFSRNQSSNPAVTNVAEVITSAAEQIFIQFTEVETNKIRLYITDTSDDGAARVAEMETFRIIEPTSTTLNDYLSSRISRRQDYTSRWYQGATWSMVFDNHHRKYSSTYKPTATEIAEDNYFNDMLNDGIIKIWKWGGYEVSSADELVQQLDGVIDTMSTDPSPPQRATYEGRDKYYMLTQKPVNVNDSDISTKSIQNYIEYILNLCNIPSSEISLPSYGITLPLTILCNANAVDKLKLLVEATGNGALYCSKQGRWEGKFINKNRKWIETNTDDFKAGAHTNTSYFDEEGTLLLDIQNGDLLNNSFETGETTPSNWKQIYSPYAGSFDGTYKVDGSYSFKAPLNAGDGPFLFSDTPRVKLEVQDAVTNEVLFSQIYNGILFNWQQLSKNDSNYRNRYIKLFLKPWRGNPGDLPTEYCYLESDPFYYSGMPISFYNLLRIFSFDPILSEIYYSYYFDYIVGGRRSYINGSFISQSHDCTQGVASEAISAFTTLKATINVPTNTTLTVNIQYSTDNTNWGVDIDGTFDDGNWTQVFAQNTAFAGDKVADIPAPGHESLIRYVRYQVVMTTADDNYTPRLYEMRINWRTGTVSTVSDTAAFNFGYQGASSGDGLLKSMKASYSSLISNQAKICTQAVCKVNRLFLSAAAEKVWDGMTGDSPLNIAIDTTLYAELEYPCKKDVNMRLQISDGVSTKNYYGDGTNDGALPANLDAVTITWGNQRIKIILDVSGAGPDLTIFEIQAKTYKPKGKVEILSLAKNYSELYEMFGEKQITIDNEFIMSHTVAKDIVDGTIDLYAKGRIRLEGVRVAFSPDAELYDCCGIKELNSGIDRNLWIAEDVDIEDGAGRAKTELSLEEI